MSDNALVVQDLAINYVSRHTQVPAVRGVTFGLPAGSTLGLVGESGCGKSTIALALMGLLPRDESRIVSGKALFRGRDLLTQTENHWRATRGKEIAIIFQDPFSSLNPVLTIKEQIQECIQLDEGRANPARANELLAQVHLSEHERILNSYPHQLSGGQRQRIMIAIALSRRPQILIADEPTTALDVTVQDEILKLLAELKKSLGMSMIFVTHNMGIVNRLADTVGVMYAGQLVEWGAAAQVLHDPKHPYTQGLLACLPPLKAQKTPLPALTGTPPDPRKLPSGCPFHPRCPKIFAPCTETDPNDRSAGSSHVRCNLY